MSSTEQEVKDAPRNRKREFHTVSNQAMWAQGGIYFIPKIAYDIRFIIINQNFAPHQAERLGNTLNSV